MSHRILLITEYCIRVIFISTCDFLISSVIVFIIVFLLIYLCDVLTILCLLFKMVSYVLNVICFVYHSMPRTWHSDKSTMLLFD